MQTRHMRLSSLLALIPLTLTIHCFQLNSRQDICAKAVIPSDMKCIPGGPFLRGSNLPSRDEDSGKMVNDESPEATVTVSAFLMDTYEVTFSQFQDCIRAGKCRAAHPNYTGYSNPKMPMLGVNWFDSRDYCAFVGKRLPTEAEWEKAARGENGDTHPWGNAPADCKHAIIQENGKKGCGPGTTADVGSRPAYRYGLYDMAGNSWEWVSDWYSPDYAKCGADCLGTDPLGPCKGAASCPGFPEKIVKGGSWWWDAEYARAANRRPHYPQNKPFHHFGFRCAKSI